MILNFCIVSILITHESLFVRGAGTKDGPLARARVAHRVVDEAHDQQRQHHDAEVRVCGGGARGESRPLYGARAGNAGRLTTNNADLLGRLLFVVREVHRAIRRAVRRIGHFICFVV